MTTAQKVLLGCGIVVLLGLLLVGGCVAMGVFFAKGLADQSVTVAGADYVRPGETFVLEVVAHNKHGEKAWDVETIALPIAYLDGFTLSSVDPLPAKTATAGEATAFTFAESIPPGGNFTFRFTLVAGKEGWYEGPVMVQGGFRFAMALVHTSVETPLEMDGEDAGDDGDESDSEPEEAPEPETEIVGAASFPFFAGRRMGPSSARSIAQARVDEEESIGLRDFPYQFMNESEEPNLIEIRLSSTQKNQLRIPFKRPGEKAYYWDAWTCTNMQCPHVEDYGKPLIFPLTNEDARRWADAGYPERTPDDAMALGVMMPMPLCPECKQPTVEPYDTPEGKKKKEDYYQFLKRKYG